MIDLSLMTAVELYALTRAVNSEWVCRERYNPKNKRWDG